jgi:valyl-tRNA synthetase
MDQYGTDALRFMMLTGSTPGQDTRLNLDRLEAGRNFANKLWNAGRLILSAIEKSPNQPDTIAELTYADEWIHNRHMQIIDGATRLFENHQYGEAGRQLYEFFWSEFADWYLEIAKLQLDGEESQSWVTTELLVRVYEGCLRMLHPFIPFVTEELWGYLRRACLHRDNGIQPIDGWGEALIVSKWPSLETGYQSNEAIIDDFRLLMDAVTAVRNIRAEKGISPRKQIAATVQAGSRLSFFVEASAALSSLAGIDPDELVLAEEVDRPDNAIPLVIGEIEIFLPLEGMVDLEFEKQRLDEELNETMEQIERLEALLGSEFAQRAPSEVVEKERAKLDTYQETKKRLIDQLEALG